MQDNLPDLKNIKLIAVSKKCSIQHIEQVINKFNILSFGENYVQEALPKINFFKKKYPQLEWHFIGPIQSNKTKQIAGHFDWVQSLDRHTIAAKLNFYRQYTFPDLPALNICIQINDSQKPGQSGITLKSLTAFLEFLKPLSALKFRGLMTMTANDYQKTAEAFYALKNLGYDIDTLSMGMSQDYPAAVKAGATMIRLGTLIFGEREKP